MKQVLLGVLIILAIVYGAEALYKINRVVALPTGSMAAVVAIPEPATNDFSTTGTIVFYPNNVEPVPYLIYQNQNGDTVAKALTFPQGEPANFSAWIGARVMVNGYVDAEHVVVRDIAYLAGP